MTIHLIYLFKFESLVFLYIALWFCVIDELHCQDIRLQNEDYSDRQNVSSSCVITSVSLTKKRGKICHYPVTVMKIACHDIYVAIQHS